METDQPQRNVAGWYPDPVGDFELRYHNGTRWTGDVSTDGERFVAPLAPPPAPSRRGRGTLALTAAVVAFAIAWIPFVCVVGAVFAVVAISLALRDRRDAASRAVATAALIVGSLALLMAAVGVWLSVVVLRAVDEYQNPGDYDVQIDACEEFDGGSRANGSITNLSKDERSYVVTVEFNDDRTADTNVDDVEPGQTVTFTVAEDLRFADLECRVSSVTGPAPFGFDLDN